jgi:hypothetical protein
MSATLNALVMLVFSLPPLLVFGLVIYIAPKLGNARRIFMFLAAFLAGCAIVGLVYLSRHYLGLQEVRLQAIVSLVLLVLVGIDYNRRYPERRY